MDGPPPSGCSACNKYPCSCLTSLSYQTHLSLLGRPRGTHNYAVRSPAAGVGGTAPLFMGHGPRAKSQKKNQIAVNNASAARRILQHSITFNSSSAFISLRFFPSPQNPLRFRAGPPPPSGEPPGSASARARAERLKSHRRRGGGRGGGAKQRQKENNQTNEI